MEYQRTVLICQDSSEGILSAIYIAYERRLMPENTDIIAGSIDNYELFTEYIEIQTDVEKAKKVENTIYKRFGYRTAYYIWCCIYSNQKDKASIIYHTIARGLAKNVWGELIHMLQEPCIMQLTKIQKNVSNEAHHFKGFLRFMELEGGGLFARLCPKNNVLPLLAEHFCDRFPKESFLIFDENHNLCLLKEAQGEAFFYHPCKEEREQLQKEELNLSDSERQVRELFRTFHSTIAIKSRENIYLQRNLLPLRFRGNMTEFNKG